MECVKVDSSNFKLIELWWSLHNWPLIPLESLPKNGLIVKNSTESLAAGFLYLTDSNMAWLEFVVGNPLSDKIERGKALDLLISSLLELAKSNQKTVIFTSCKHLALQKRYQAHGAVLADEGVTHLIWRL